MMMTNHHHKEESISISKPEPAQIQNEFESQQPHMEPEGRLSFCCSLRPEPQPPQSKQPHPEPSQLLSPPTQPP